MKYFYSLVLVALLPAFAFSQCLADAGSDQHFCSDFQKPDTITLGGLPTASGGAMPYNYKWSYLNPPGAFFKLKASVLLNDTTVANPEFYGNGAYDTSTFVVEVVDNNSISCFDTVVITESIFVSHLGQYSMAVNAGDTITFLFGSNVMSNLPIKSYLWRPNHGMIDSTSLNPTLAPSKSMAYHVVITDSAGCTVKGGDCVFVTVNYVGLDEAHLQDEIKLYPNPAQSYLGISFPEGLASSQFNISIRDANGRSVKTFTHEKGEEFKGEIALPNGLYFVEISKSGERIGNYKLMVEK